MSDTNPGLTILIPTHNRAVVLERTLRDLTTLDCSGLDWSIIVIDNNSTDQTSRVAEQFKERLPLTVMYEPRPGKNCALNKALREGALKDIVIFSDDDITPEADWLRKIVAAAQRNPDVSVFGGTIEVGWPPAGQPEWLVADWLVRFGCSQHRYSKTETFYRHPMCPSGGNLWVRRAVFEKVPRFDETIGPRPKNRITGSETSFLLRLRGQGFEILHCPDVVVYHRLEPEACQIATLRRRGFRFGRGTIRLHGWRWQRELAKSKCLWIGFMAADFLYTGIRFAVGALSPFKRFNCEMTVDSTMRFGELYETVNQAYTGMRSCSRRLPSRDQELAAQVGNDDHYEKVLDQKPL